MCIKHLITSLVAIWNNQYLPSKSIELWNLAQTQVNMEKFNGAVNIFSLSIFKLCHFKAFDN